MKNFIVSNVPEYAEFHKYWVVEETNDDGVLTYKSSYLNIEDAVKYLENTTSFNLKIIKNDNWANEREFLNG